jgi:hypothetical protein
LRRSSRLARAGHVIIARALGAIPDFHHGLLTLDRANEVRERLEAGKLRDRAAGRATAIGLQESQLVEQRRGHAERPVRPMKCADYCAVRGDVRASSTPCASAGCGGHG